jgi:hypothetical protein
MAADPIDLYAPEPLARARRDLRQAAATLSLQEVRYLVDTYYEVQRYRISSANQVRALEEGEEPTSLLTWTSAAFATVEDEIRKGLDVFSRKEPSGLGAWARSIVGVGPVLASGLLAHLDVERAPTVGHFWRFAGLDPTQQWERGQKRPWNASLKVICWKLGESFVKVSGNRNDVYGKLYQSRKLYEADRNASGALAEQAAAMLTRKRIGKETDAYAAYSAGTLPPAHIHARAKRWAVKAFLADYHHVSYELRYGTRPPFPYPIAHLGHAHERGVPNHLCVAAES